MNASDLNSEEVSAALLLVDKAEKALKAALVARDYPEGSIWSSPGGWTVYVLGGTHYVGEQSFADALAYIQTLPVIWTPSLCEQTLYAGVAA